MDIRTKNCSNCFHKRVCSLKDKYTTYQNEMKELITKWGKDNPFGFSTDCPEYHAQPHTGTTRDTKPKSDLDIWNNPFRVTYDLNDSIDQTIKPNCEDEITTTVEDGLRSVGKTSKEYKEEEYDFLKELEKISMKNKIYFI